MSDTFRRLYAASFRGAKFLVAGKCETVGGRKIVTHEYPGIGKRYVEDLGLLGRKFSIIAVVKAPQYFENRDKLIKALEDEGPGILSHPFYGNVKVSPEPYSLSEDLASVGEGVFTLTFIRADNIIYPKEAKKTFFTKFLDKVTSSVSDYISNSFIADFAQNLQPLKGVLNDVADAFDEISRTQALISDNINAFQSSVTSFRNTINSLVLDSASLAISLNNMFETLLTVVENPLSSLSLYKNLFGFASTPKLAGTTDKTFGDISGETSVFIPEDENDDPSQLQPITEIRKERIASTNVINMAMNANAIAYSYFMASKVDYESNIEIESTVKDLEIQYERIANDLDETVLEAVNDIRDKFREFTNENLLSVDKVMDTFTNKTPVEVLTQSYYGSLDNYDKIISLNENINPAEISGNIKVFSQ